MNLLLTKILSAVRTLRGVKKHHLWEAFVAGGVVGFILCIGAIASELTAKRETLKDLIPKHQIVKVIEVSSATDGLSQEAIKEESQKASGLAMVIRQSAWSPPLSEAIVVNFGRFDGINRIQAWFARVVGNRGGPTGYHYSFLPVYPFGPARLSLTSELPTSNQHIHSDLSTRKTRSLL